MTNVTNLRRASGLQRGFLILRFYARRLQSNRQKNRQKTSVPHRRLQHKSETLFVLKLILRLRRRFEDRVSCGP